MRQALTLTYEQHRERLHALASRYAPQDAEDIVQDAFVRALQWYPRFRHDATLSTWLHRVVINECISRYRRSRVRQRVDVLRSRHFDTCVRPVSVETIEVRAALRSLPQQESLVLVLYEVMGHTHDEIAAFLGIPAGTSKWRLHAARRRLQKAVAPEEGPYLRRRSGSTASDKRCRATFQVRTCRRPFNGRRR